MGSKSTTGFLEGREGPVCPLGISVQGQDIEVLLLFASLDLPNPEQTQERGAASHFFLYTNPTHVAICPSGSEPDCPTAKSYHKALALGRHAGNGKGP